MFLTAEGKSHQLTPDVLAYNTKMTSCTTHKRLEAVSKKVQFAPERTRQHTDQRTSTISALPHTATSACSGIAPTADPHLKSRIFVATKFTITLL